MSNIEKAVLGGLGGFSAVLVKFLGQDYSNIVAHAANLTADQLLAYKVGYLLLTPILIFLGAFVAWLSDEEKRLKIVAIAIAAPAIITTWSGGHKADYIAFNNLLVNTSYAQSTDSIQGKSNPVAPDTITVKNIWQQIKSGVGAFFGYGKEPKRYWVIVGSYKDKNAAQQFADKINTEDKTLNAWVGVKLPDNPNYPVIVGDYVFLSDAKKLKQRALATKSINDVYFSTGQQR